MESEEKIKNDKEKKTQHIMFSYSWTQKNQVSHIYDIIDNEYSEVPKWIDINQMSGNIIEAMGDAVENSFLVIIFLSKNYKNSKNCKTESELVIGKQKKYILVLIDKGYPYLEDDDENWLSKMFKNQFYIDLTEMDSSNLNKLKELIYKEIVSYYKLDEIPYKRVQRRASFSSSPSIKKKSSLNMIGSPLGSPIRTLTKSDSKELDNFILNNNLNQDDVDSIKNLVIKTPRTMVPALQAGGVSFKSILNIISDIKNEESDRDYNETDFS